MDTAIEDAWVDEALAAMEAELELGPTPADGLDRLGVLESLCGHALSDTSTAPGPALGWLVDQVDPASLDEAGLRALIVAFVRQRDHLQAGLTKAIAELAQHEPLIEPGPANRIVGETPRPFENAQSTLEAELGWSAGRAWRELSLALSLTQELPATLEALDRGEVSADVAATISENIPPTIGQDVRVEIERQTLKYVQNGLAHNVRRSRADVQRKVAREVVKHDPDGAYKRREQKNAARDLILHPDVDSVADLILHGIPAEDAVQIYAMVDSMARRAKQRGDERTMPQLRADFTVDILTGRIHLIDSQPDQTHRAHDDATANDRPNQAGATAATAAGTHNTAATAATAAGTHNTAATAATAAGTHNTAATAATAAGTHNTAAGDAPGPREYVRWQPKTRIVLTVPLPTVLGLATQPAMLGGFGPIVIEAARRIIANNLTNPDAEIQIAVTHPVTGALLQLHPMDPRFYRGRLRQLVETLWPDCTWMTCTKPAATSEIDHITERASRGPTVPDNGHPACKQHHRRKTFLGWTTHKDPATGAIAWTSPYGEQYVIAPPRLTDEDTNLHPAREVREKDPPLYEPPPF